MKEQTIKNKNYCKMINFYQKWLAEIGNVRLTLAIFILVIEFLVIPFAFILPTYKYYICDFIYGLIIFPLLVGFFNIFNFKVKYYETKLIDLLKSNILNQDKIIYNYKQLVDAEINTLYRIFTLYAIIFTITAYVILILVALKSNYLNDVCFFYFGVIATMIGIMLELFVDLNPFIDKTNKELEEINRSGEQKMDAKKH